MRFENTKQNTGRKLASGIVMYALEPRSDK